MWTSLLSTMLFKVHPLVVYINASFLFMGKLYYVIWTHQILCINPSINEHFTCFHLLAISIKAPMNIHVHIFM